MIMQTELQKSHQKCNFKVAKRGDSVKSLTFHLRQQICVSELRCCVVLDSLCVEYLLSYDELTYLFNS